MKLSPRLEAVASLVPVGRAAADIGTDHGYLPVFLVNKNICPYVIAGDKSEKPLEKARELVKTLKMEEKILIRLGDGLEVIKEREKVSVIIIAGMGGKTICSILEKEFSRLSGIEVLILQPMVDIPLVRRWIGENGFKITDEKLAREGSQFYEIIAAEPGVQEPLDEVLLELGPKILGKKDPL
ncbi:MAG: SAM-dependent methyltransferase, partial [Firmicutes bacterium HGW-Firmicutes-13]